MAHYHVAIPNTKDRNRKKTLKYLQFVDKDYELRTKPLKYIKSKNRVVRKGDVDIELVLDIVRSIEKLDLVIIVSGDSDYLELKNWVTQDKRKQIIFIAFIDNMAWEIKYCSHIYFEEIKNHVKKIPPR